VQIN